MASLAVKCAFMPTKRPNKRWDKNENGCLYFTFQMVVHKRSTPEIRVCMKHNLPMLSQRTCALGRHAVS